MLRRDGKLFRRGLLPALVLTLLMAAVCALAAFSVLQSTREGRKPVNVAVVDNEGGLLSRFCINLVSSQSYIASLMDVTQTSEKKAVQGLNKGTYEAVIILPKGYTDNIMYGYEGTGQIILSEAAAASADIVRSVANFGERLLAAGQYGIFAGENLIEAHSLSGEFHNDFLDKNNSELLSVAVSVFDEGMELSLTPYFGSTLTTEAYYALAWFVLLASVCGLFFTALYTEDRRRSVLLRLYSLDVTPGGFLQGKLLYPFLYRLGLAIAFLAGISRLLPLSFSAASLLEAMLALIMMSVIFGCAAVILGGQSGWQGILLALSVAGLFFNGGLVPRSMLPQSLLTLGRFTPSGAAMSLLAPLFGGKTDPLSDLCGLLYAGILFLLALHTLRQLPVKGGEE